jgi:hypothetical protein
MAVSHFSLRVEYLHAGFTNSVAGRAASPRTAISAAIRWLFITLDSHDVANAFFRPGSGAREHVARIGPPGVLDVGGPFMHELVVGGIVGQVGATEADERIGFRASVD